MVQEQLLRRGIKDPRVLEAMARVPRHLFVPEELRGRAYEDGPLPIGEHQYQFVVDGRTWRPDSTAHAQVDDGFGGTNSVIVVGPKGLVRT